jgi:hypothetical protein
MVRLLPILPIAMLMASCSNINKTKNVSSNTADITIAVDTVSLIRNPAMGWGLYDDSDGEVQDANQYWRDQDEAAQKYASFFYVRWRWSDMEPEEGKYAWLYNDNFKQLIQGALERGLKLCFRVYDNGQDNLRPGTPDFVRTAGARGYDVRYKNMTHWTAYPDDPIFQEKWSNFVKAFAKEFDNPDMVDFVDGFSIGAWGEVHTIKLIDPSKLNQVFDWYTSLYTQNFKKVLLALPFNGQVGFDTEKRIAINGKGYNMRRDGLGSMWFNAKEKLIAKQMFGKVLLIGESCYWSCSTDDCRPFASDTQYAFNNWQDVYKQAYEDAISYRFNTLDLREQAETRGWAERAPELVKNFVLKGGYRLYPSEVKLPTKVKPGEWVNVKHNWKNIGVGYIPNNNVKWHYKYKPAIALINDKNEVLGCWIDDKAEPSQWIDTAKTYRYSFNIQLPQLAKGKYSWAIAIVDKTKENKAAINLAIANAAKVNGWYKLSDLVVE